MSPQEIERMAVNSAHQAMAAAKARFVPVDAILSAEPDDYDFICPTCGAQVQKPGPCIDCRWPEGLEECAECEEGCQCEKCTETLADKADRLHDEIQCGDRYPFPPYRLR